VEDGGAGRAALQPPGRLTVVHPLGGHEPHPEPVHPPRDERQHPGALGVEPLEAVHGQRHGPLGGQSPHHVEDGDPDGEPPPPVPALLTAQQHTPQRLPQGRRERLQTAVRHRREQVEEPGEGEPGVVLGGRAPQDGSPRVREEGAEQDGLADSLGTVQQHTASGVEFGPSDTEQLVAPGLGTDHVSMTTWLESGCQKT